MEQARVIEFIIETKRGLYRHEYSIEKKDFHVSKTPISRLIELMTKYQNEGIVQYNMVVKSLNTTLTQPYNLVCDVEIELKDNYPKYQEHYVYGPTGDVSFDLVGTPGAFLQNGIDYFDYESIQKIQLTIQRDE